MVYHFHVVGNVVEVGHVTLTCNQGTFGIITETLNFADRVSYFDYYIKHIRGIANDITSINCTPKQDNSECQNVYLNINGNCDCQVYIVSMDSIPWDDVDDPTDSITVPYDSVDTKYIIYIYNQINQLFPLAILILFY